MITLKKLENRCDVFCETQQLGWLEFHDNPKHTKNCYVRIFLDDLDINISAELWDKVKALAGRPLQVMVDSTSIAMIDFLIAGGFVCKRKCFEVAAHKEDYVGGAGSVELHYCSAGDPNYEKCCHIMYRHYVDTHKEINPWTAGYAEFCTELPQMAVYASNGNSIMSVAFVEDNEIAYVGSLSEQHFLNFARTLMMTMYVKYDNIFFECDDCDRVAMSLKKLFINQDESSFCTYILENKNECRSNLRTSSCGI